MKENAENELLEAHPGDVADADLRALLDGYLTVEVDQNIRGARCAFFARDEQARRGGVLAAGSGEAEVGTEAPRVGRRSRRRLGGRGMLEPHGRQVRCDGGRMESVPLGPERVRCTSTKVVLPVVTFSVDKVYLLD